MWKRWAMCGLVWSALMVGEGMGAVEAEDRADVVYADFEGETYGDWKVEGEAFGSGPAGGTLAGQMRVEGYDGKLLVNSYHGGDGSTGTLTSPPFTIERPYIAFLIGGGGFEGETCVNLLVEGKVVRSGVGPNTRPGGSEALAPDGWDVKPWEGKAGRLQIVDRATGGWGHINVDQIVFTDRKPASRAARIEPSRAIMADARWLCLPVKNGGPARKVRVVVGGKPVRAFDIEAADGEPDWWAALDVSAWRGEELTVQVDRLGDESTFMSRLEIAADPKGREDLYDEALRPQLHFSPARGWNNDPNGLVYYRGEYHLFFQFNPYGVKWGNMHWGHAVTKDLIHWREVGVALYPDEMGAMFSGSAVVDWRNTSGLGTVDHPAMVLAYTAAGADVQCLASSTDGRSFSKFAGNPVVRRISGGNRDPKVFWHEPTKRWIMALYVEAPSDKGGSRRRTIRFLSSPDLKAWTETGGSVEGFHECPDLFPLQVEGGEETKWVLSAASSDYMIGQFDGRTFTPQTPMLKGHRGRGFYAAQTFNDLPRDDGRRIMIGWFQTPAPGMPFSQSMTVPLNVTLRAAAEGLRLAYLPVREIESLRAASKRLGPVEIGPGMDALEAAGAELLDVRADFASGDAEEVLLTVRGLTIRCMVKSEQIEVKGVRAPAPLVEGRQRLIVLVDHNSVEIFASDGLTYIPLPFIVKPSDVGVSMDAKGGAAKVRSLEVHTLRSIWPAPTKPTAPPESSAPTRPAAAPRQ